MTTSILSLFQAGLFRKYYFVSSQLKHLKPKTIGLGISKMWSTIFSPSILTKISGNLSRFQLKINKSNCTNVKYPNFGKLIFY